MSEKDFSDAPSLNGPASEGMNLAQRVQDAVAAYNAMDPVDRALHDADQRRSFVRGQSGRDPGIDVLADEVRRLLEALKAALGTAREPSISPELTALGEAAVRMMPLHDAYENSTANTSRSADALMALTYAEDDVLAAARAHAASVAEVKHG